MGPGVSLHPFTGPQFHHLFPEDFLPVFQFFDFFGQNLNGQDQPGLAGWPAPIPWDILLPVGRRAGWGLAFQISRRWGDLDLTVSMVLERLRMEFQKASAPRLP